MTADGPSIDGLVPSAVVWRSTTSYVSGADLIGTERDAIRRAVPRRAAEFATGRFLAREALSELGLPREEIAVGARREPLWPDGVVGSITHCEDFVAVAVARRTEISTLGIDAEPVGRHISADVAATVCTGRDTEALAHFGPAGPLYVFTAKEAVYKAWFPLTGAWLGFGDVAIRPTGEDGFRVELLVADPVNMSSVRGVWVRGGGVIVAAAILAEPVAP